MTGNEPALILVAAVVIGSTILIALLLCLFVLIQIMRTIRAVHRLAETTAPALNDVLREAGPALRALQELTHDTREAISGFRMLGSAIGVIAQTVLLLQAAPWGKLVLRTSKPLLTDGAHGQWRLQSRRSIQHKGRLDGP